jgi:hypothetical protein
MSWSRVLALPRWHSRLGATGDDRLADLGLAVLDVAIDRDLLAAANHHQRPCGQLGDAPIGSLQPVSMAPLLTMVARPKLPDWTNTNWMNCSPRTTEVGHALGRNPSGTGH